MLENIFLILVLIAVLCIAAIVGGIIEKLLPRGWKRYDD